MRRFRLLIPLLCLSCATHAQVSSENYIRTRTMLNNKKSSYIDNIAYFDGLGRPFQNVEKSVKENVQTGHILATLQEYDAASRKTNTWLPIEITSDYIAPPDFRSNAPGNYGNDAQPYSYPVYEASPLKRIASQYDSGAAWSTHPVQTEYLVNSTAIPLSCINYSVGNESTLLSNGNYAVGQLSVIKASDEDGNTSYSFTDKLGHTLLTRQMKEDDTYDTYYVYDDFGNLCFVLQPMYQENTDLNLYAFQYKYDGKNRCILKKLPGVEPIEYVYGSSDLPAFSQDGKQKPKNEWTFYEKDKYGRIIKEKECFGKNPMAIKQMHATYYYDNYNFLSDTGFTDRNIFPTTTINANGFPTGSVITVLGSDDKLYTANYYDEKGRVIKTVQSNLLGGYEVICTDYTFTGKPLTVTHRHTASGKEEIVEKRLYKYDHADRIQRIQHILNGDTATLVTNTYDKIGRLQIKAFHGSGKSGQQYSYNIRGWLTEIKETRFKQNLYYNDGPGTPCYNGNISSMTWQTDDNVERGYKFSYDRTNRLLNAVYGEGISISSNIDNFTEKVTSYDRNGNILGLQRYGQISSTEYGMIDNLTMALNGNQLNRVDDASGDVAYAPNFEFKDNISQANEYVYDINGNLTKDLNKGISDIQYNYLNLLSLVTFEDGSTISYLYAADGTKLRVTYKAGGTTTTTDYCGNVIYENGVVQLLLTEEGYVSLNNKRYHYYLKDYQGNNRMLMYRNDNEQKWRVEETNHYYPFGGIFASSGNVQPYKYNGKELDTKKGLNWYDYGARQYDAAVGRFTTVDPMMEAYNNTSPYTYCLNNPIKLVDPTGCFASTHTDSLGNVTDVFNDGDLGVYRHNTDFAGTKKEVAEKYSRTNTAAGGEKMGETYEWNSFLNSGEFEPTGQIHFGSYEASQKVFNAYRNLTGINLKPVELLAYALNANNGETFDIKSGRPYDGSQFGTGKYISMRDAGNILAGMVARRGGLSAKMTYTLFGALQLSENKRWKMPFNMYRALRKGASLGYGETPISHTFQRRGYELNFK